VAAPGIAASGNGTSIHLSGELFKALNKINMVHVPYKGASLALTAMLSGEVDMVTSTLPATIPHVKSGRIRALAVLAPERAAALPQVPTSAEAGMPKLVVITWYGLFAPAGVKPETIARLNTEVGKLMNAPEAKNKLTQVGLDAATGTPAEFATFVQADYEKWLKIAHEANIVIQ